MSIRVTRPDWDGGYLEAVPGPAAWTWRAVGPVPEGFKEVADSISSMEDYSPADGQPGHALARRVAQTLGAKAVLPPVPETPSGAVN